MTTMELEPALKDRIPDTPGDGNPPSALEVLEGLELAYPTYFAEPMKLVRGPNRPEKPDDPDFDADLAKNGNDIPIIVSVIDGRLVVEDGWHRTRALQRAAVKARESGQKVRKAWIIALPEDTEADEKQRVIARVRMQFSTGKYRVTQDDADRLAATAALFEVKATDKEVRENLGLTTREIRAYRKVAKSATATAAVMDHQFDIFHAADADRYANDPRRHRLVQAELDGNFDYVFAEMVAEDEARAAEEAARAEAEATRIQVAAAYEAAVTDYADRGFHVVDEIPEGLDCWPLELLLTASGDRAGEVDAAAQPDAFAVVLTQRIVHIDTGELIAPDRIDDFTRANPDAEASNGQVHARHVREEDSFYPSYFCLDPDAAALTVDEASFPESTDSDARDDVSGTAADQPTETIEERHERQQREAERDRQRAADVNRVRALNTKSVAAANRRRKFVRENWFTGKKTIPAGMGELIGMVVGKSALLERYTTSVLAAELGKHLSDAPVGGGVKARDNHGLLYAALRVVAAMEADILPNLEVSESKAKGWRGVREPLWKPYIELLATHGHNRAPFDYILTGELTADQVYNGDTEPAAPKDQDTLETDSTTDTSDPVTTTGPDLGAEGSDRQEAVVRDEELASPKAA
ncbi:hypothetical protein [Nocardia sp. CA-119907]|uniref:hypothetical protein n=1 Tax=Nocardia sp. CA-119907 TaxID=3239973 RepID=UPI003D97B087